MALVISEPKCKSDWELQALDVEGFNVDKLVYVMVVVENVKDR